MSIRDFTLSIRDELAEIADAFERGDDVIGRRLVFELRDRVERVADGAGWTKQVDGAP